MELVDKVYEIIEKAMCAYYTGDFTLTIDGNNVPITVVDDWNWTFTWHTTSTLPVWATEWSIWWVSFEVD